MPTILLLLLNQIEQVLLYIAGFGFSDLFMEKMKFTSRQKIIYFSIITLIALCILFYTQDN